MEQAQNTATIKNNLPEMGNIANQPQASHTDVMKNVAGTDNVEKVNTLNQMQVQQL